MSVGPIAVRPVEAKRAIREAEAAKEVSLGGEEDPLPKDVVDEAIVAGPAFDVDDDDEQNKMETRPEDSTPPPTSILGKMGTAFAAATYSQALEGKAMEEPTYDNGIRRRVAYYKHFPIVECRMSHVLQFYPCDDNFFVATVRSSRTTPIIIWRQSMLFHSSKILVRK